MENLFDPAHLFNLFALIAYILIKELILDKKNLRKQLHDAQTRKQQDSIRDEQQRGPLKALELDFSSLKSKVVNLEDAIEKQSEMLSDKLDIILADFKEKHAENRADLKEMQRGQADMSARISALEARLKISKR